MARQQTESVEGCIAPLQNESWKNTGVDGAGWIGSTWLVNGAPDGGWTESECARWQTQTHPHTHTLRGNGLDRWQWEWHWWQHRSRWSSMAMTDSRPTWGQSPPLELDCTTRPHRRGELLCLTSPDRPIRAARNWDALGPTAGWEGLQKGKTPPTAPKHQAHTVTTDTRHACAQGEVKGSGAFWWRHAAVSNGDAQFKVWGLNFSPLIDAYWQQSSGNSASF